MSIAILVWQKVTLNIVFIINQKTFIFWKKMALYRSCWKRNFKRQKVNDASSSLGPFCLASDCREIDIASSINFPANYTSSALYETTVYHLLKKLRKCIVFRKVAAEYFHKSMSTVWNLNFIQVVLLCSQFHFELNHWKWWKMMEKRFLSDKERFVLSWRHLKNFPFNLPHFSKFCKWFSNGFPFIEFNDTECIFWKSFLKDLIRLKLTGNLQQ